MAAKWYYQNQGKDFGPISGSELRQLAHSGSIGPATPVRKEDGNWVHARRVNGLLPTTSEPTASTPVPISGIATTTSREPAPPPVAQPALAVPTPESTTSVTESKIKSVLVECSCGHTIRASESLVGKKETCPSCNRDVKITGGRYCTHEVFICHSTKDVAVAEAVCQSLESRGRKCWIAPRDVPVGSKWASTIIEAITGSRVIVLVHSVHANRSPQVLREVERAVAKNVPIVPIKIDKTTLSRDLEYFLGPTHWFDASDVPLAESIRDLTLMVDSLASGRAGINIVRQVPRKRLILRRIAFTAFSFVTGIVVAIAAIYLTRGPSRQEMSSELAGMITSQIAVDSWEAVGGMAVMDEYEGALVVTATFQIQQQVNQFLNHLRSTRGLNEQSWKPSGETVAISRFREILEETTTEGFTDYPLDEAMGVFSDVHSVPIVIDTRSLEMIGLDPTTSVSLSVKNLPLKDAFELMLRDLDLTFTIGESGIMIMTIDDAEAFGELTVAHDVSDLLSDYREWQLPYEPVPDRRESEFGLVPNDPGANNAGGLGGFGNEGGMF